MDAVQEFCDHFELSRRQRSIFTMLVAGVSPKEIACRLSLSHVTIRRHAGEIYKRCGTRNFRETLAMYARATWGRRKTDGNEVAALPLVGLDIRDQAPAA